MAVVTVAAEVGSGAAELAQEVARLLGADLVDHQVLATAAVRLGVGEGSLEVKEATLSLRKRLARALETFLERSATADPTLEASGMEVVLSRTYAQALEPASALVVSDERYVDILRSVMLDLAQEGNVVILRRGGQALLQRKVGVLHVCAVASDKDKVARTMGREEIAREAAEKYLREAEHSRLAYFKKFFKVDPRSSSLYHLTINTSLLPIDKAAQVVAQAARLLEGAST